MSYDLVGEPVLPCHTFRLVPIRLLYCQCGNAKDLDSFCPRLVFPFKVKRRLSQGAISDQFWSRTRSRAEGDSRSGTNGYGSIKADLATIGPQATPRKHVGVSGRS